MSYRPPLTIALGELRLPGKLRIDYTITNEGRVPFYVYSCIAAKANRPLLHQAYTCYWEKDQALHLSLGVPPIPKGLHVYAKIVPYAWLLRPGERHAEYIELPFPVPEWCPYVEPPPPEEVEIVQVR